MTGTYRAAVCTALSGPGAVEIRHLPRAAPGPGEVRVQVRAAGLNFPDLLMTRGGYQHRPEPPFVPGMEFAGEIAELGEGVEGWRVGDRVTGGGKGGAFAEECVVPAAALAPLSPAFSFEEGACWRAAAQTAWHALHDKARLEAGETILVLGASGGVGMAAVSLAKHVGATVIGTGSTAAKREAVLAMGAAHTLDPADSDLPARVKALTAGRGVDVVFDPVGGELALAGTRSLAWGGRFLIIGFASGTIPDFPANHALIKGYSLIGLRAGESGRRDQALAERTARALAALAANGVMRPHISHRLGLDDAASGLELLERRAVIGRAVLVP